MLPKKYIYGKYIYGNKPKKHIIKHEPKKHVYENKEVDVDFYRACNPDLEHMTDEQLVEHYTLYGKNEGRKPNNLDVDFYRACNPDLQHMTDKQLVEHYTLYGKNEGRKPNNLNVNAYREYNPDLQHMTDEQLVEHYIKYGYITQNNLNVTNDQVVEKHQPLENYNVGIVFVCHDLKTFNKVEKHLKLNNCYVIIVGNKICLHDIFCKNEKIIIAKNLNDNIEDEHKLLTFTAWYLIVRNELLLNYSHLCILEYDANLKYEGSFTYLDTLVKNCNYDVISFNGGPQHFHSDINVNVKNNFLDLKNINIDNYNSLHTFWYHSTNHCIKRNILVDFVNWYYPDCLYLKLCDYEKLSYYHERLFSVYIINNNYRIYYLANYLTHIQEQSHVQKDYVMEKQYFLTYDDNTTCYNNDRNNLINSVSKYSNFQTIVFNKNNIDFYFNKTNEKILNSQRGGGYWLWKPYIILATLNNMNNEDLLFYLDSKYYFVKNFENLYKDKLNETNIIVWKNKPNEEITYLKNYCKMDVIKKYNIENLTFNYNCECCWAGAIIIKKTNQTMQIMKEWLEMCCNYNDITDSPSTIPNSSLFIDHRHDQSLLSIVLHKYNIKFYFFEKEFMQNVRQPW